MKTISVVKLTGVLFVCLLVKQTATAQDKAPGFTNQALFGNQTSRPFYISSNPENGAGPYVEMINNTSGDVSRAGSIGYIAGYNRANPAGVSHTFYSRTAGGSGWISHLRVLQNGQVQIGQRVPKLSQTDYRLAVDGKLVAQSLYVTNPGTWADFVFAPAYKPMPLIELESYLLRNKHLPAIPSADEVEANGYNVSEMDAKLLQSVEELTLHVIDLSKWNQRLKADMEELKAKMAGQAESVK